MKVTKLERALLTCFKEGLLDANEAATINTSVKGRAAISKEDTISRGLGTFYRDKAIELTSTGDHSIHNMVGFDIACPCEETECL